MSLENKTTGGNLSMDHNLRTKLGFPDGKLNINETTEELIENSLLALLIGGLELFIVKTYGRDIPSDLQEIVNKLSEYYNY